MYKYKEYLSDLLKIINIIEKCISTLNSIGKIICTISN